MMSEANAQSRAVEVFQLLPFVSFRCHEVPH